MAKHESVTTVSSGGIGFSTVLFLIFLVLKLCNVISWSWWWVTAPLWVPIALFIAICLIVFLVGFSIGVVRSIIKVYKERH